MTRVAVEGSYVTEHHTNCETPEFLQLKYGDRFIECRRADESLNSLLVSPTGETFIVMSLAAVEGDELEALYMAMQPAFARRFAEQLTAHADKAERGRAQ